MKQKHNDLHSLGRLAAWWPGDIPRDTPMPAIKFVGHTLRPMQGVRPSLHVAKDDNYQQYGASSAVAGRYLVVAVGELGRRRSIGHVPFFCHADRQAQYMLGGPDALINWCSVGWHVSSRVWLRDSESCQNPLLSLLVVAPALWHVGGQPQLAIEHGPGCITIARGNTSVSRDNQRVVIDPGIDTFFYRDSHGLGEQRIIIHRNNHPDAWVRVTQKKGAMKQVTVINPDLSVSEVERVGFQPDPSGAAPAHAG